MGSSFLPGELTAAFLWAQLEKADWITQQRLATWQRYHDLLAPLERAGQVRRPIIPAGCQHNAHMYYVRLPAGVRRAAVLEEFKREDIGALFHYVPLHSSPGGLKYCRTHGSLRVTDSAWQELIRLPLWIGLTENQQARVVGVLRKHVRSAA